MAFLDSVFRQCSLLHILFLSLSLGFLLVRSQEPPLFTQSPTPPPPPPPSAPPPLVNVTDIFPPPPVAETIAPLSSPSPQPQPQRSRSDSLPLPPEPQRFGSPDESKRGGLNKGETVGLVFAGIAAMLQVLVVVFLVLKRKQLLKLNETQ